MQQSLFALGVRESLLFDFLRHAQGTPGKHAGPKVEVSSMLEGDRWRCHHHHPTLVILYLPRHGQLHHVIGLCCHLGGFLFFYATLFCLFLRQFHVEADLLGRVPGGSTCLPLPLFNGTVPRPGKTLSGLFRALSCPYFVVDRHKAPRFVLIQPRLKPLKPEGRFPWLLMPGFYLAHGGY
jgi:hypothetical protein